VEVGGWGGHLVKEGTSPLWSKTPHLEHNVSGALERRVMDSPLQKVEG